MPIALYICVGRLRQNSQVQVGFQILPGLVGNEQGVFVKHYV